MSYIAYAWLTPIFYGIGSIAAKLSSKYHVSNPWLFNFIWTVITLLCITPLALINHVGWPQDWGSMVYLGLMGAISGTLFIFSLKALDISILGPFYSFRTPMVAILGVILFGEVLTNMQIVFIGLIFFAGLFVSVDERMSIRSFFRPEIGLAFITIISSAVFNTAVKSASLHNSFWSVTFWSTLLTLIFILPTLPLFYRELITTRVSRYQGILWSTIFLTLGLLTSYKALGQNVSISIAIMTLPLSMVFAFILSRIAPKLLEKHTIKVYAVRFAAATVMFLAALGLSR